MPVVSIHMPEQSGQSGLTLFLRKTSDGTLLNTGGDALSESPASSGRFVATVAEDVTETLAAAIRNAGGLTVRDGWLAAGETIVRDSFPSAGSSGGLTPTQDQTLSSIAVALAGNAPVEPTGTTVFDLLEQIADSTGTGARTVTITVNDGTTVLQNARVRLTEGANTYTGLTSASGVVTFNLDDATYVVSITKSGYSFAGTTLVVDGTETRTYSMSAISVTPPADPALCAVTIPIVNQFGAALSGEPVEIRFNEFATGADTTAIVLSPPPALTSAAGLIEVNLLRDGKYSVFYGQGDYKRRLDFTVPDAGSFTVGE